MLNSIYHVNGILLNQIIQYKKKTLNQDIKEDINEERKSVEDTNSNIKINEVAEAVQENDKHQEKTKEDLEQKLAEPKPEEKNKEIFQEEENKSVDKVKAEEEENGKPKPKMQEDNKATETYEETFELKISTDRTERKISGKSLSFANDNSLKEENKNDKNENEIKEKEEKNGKKSEVECTSITAKDKNLIETSSNILQNIEVVGGSLPINTSKFLDQLFTSNKVNHPLNTRFLISEHSSNIPFVFGSLLPNNPSVIASNPSLDDQIFVGFKNGTCAIGHVKENLIELSKQLYLESEEIKDVFVCQGKKCKGAFLVTAEMKKSVFLVYMETKNNISLDLNRIPLVRMEENEPSLAEWESDVRVIEVYNKDIIAFCQNYIFFWRQKCGRYNMKKINLKTEIIDLILTGGNYLLVLTQDVKFILINVSSFSKECYDIKEKFNITLKEDARFIHLSEEFFLLENGNKFEMFKFSENQIIHHKTFGKNSQAKVESYRKINEKIFLLSEVFKGKRSFKAYKFHNGKFKFVGGPYVTDISNNMQSYCVCGEDLLIVVEKDSNKLFAFRLPKFE